MNHSATIHALPGQPQVLDIFEAASLLRVHPVTMRKLAPKLGRKIGKFWRFSRESLMSHLRGSVGEINTAYGRTPPAHGAATSPSAAGASAFLAGQPFARKRKNGARSSQRKRGAKRV